MSGKIFIGFKGKNNASCILVKSISADSYLLTNSFEGLKRDIESLSCSYDSVILFGIDKNLTDKVRIEKVAELDTKYYSVLNLENMSKQLEAVGISNYLSDKPTHYLCNAAYWYLLRKFNGKAVLIHIPSIKSFNLLHFEYSEIRELKAETSGPYIEDDVYYTIAERFKFNYKLLLGNSDFAVSFLTSEWLYRQHSTMANLDNTFMVAGYLKSIEQILWDIISTVAVGKYIGSSRIGDDDVDKNDTMLGSLKCFLNYSSNQELFNTAFGEDAKHVQRYLNYQLDSWITKNRNGYFHKHNMSEEQVGEIRKQTYFLYFLILGSLHLTNDNIKKLMR